MYRIRAEDEPGHQQAGLGLRFTMLTTGRAGPTIHNVNYGLGWADTQTGWVGRAENLKKKKFQIGCVFRTIYYDHM